VPEANALLDEDYFRIDDDDLRMCPKFVTGESLRTLVSSIYREKIW